MKTLEDIVASLELSKRLYKYWKDDGLFWWSEYTYFSDGEKVTDWILKEKRQADKWVGMTIPARTSEELLEKLPRGFYLVKSEVGEDFYVWGGEDGDVIEPIHADTPQEALGNMLLYLYENELIKR